VGRNPTKQHFDETRFLVSLMLREGNSSADTEFVQEWSAEKNGNNLIGLAC